jgi:hypothetical protein
MSSLAFGAGYVPAKHQDDEPSFLEVADETLRRYAGNGVPAKGAYQLEVTK